MNDQQVREIAEAAFKARFGAVDVVSINVKPGLDYDDDPLVDARIIYAAAFEDRAIGGVVPDMRSSASSR